ncbi:copper resistance system multicopper oxidase [Lysobacter sp. K5869]|uniref:copper resistance system multicopper oxidase n=1 Tax=Lysobacter sp. K5869 TaxID=2820808 RepID=UPI001C061036|nr:copper resistance system multicopper oxidase [Lysobacter sp. K5869]QWP75261.1 copper resistance system multicopper oxidase [Lysobacter sp. K5869]
MTLRIPPFGAPADPGRRRFVAGLAAGGAIAGSGLWRGAFAAPMAQTPRVLSGTEFDLDIGATQVNFTGRVRPAVTVNGSLPAPILRWREGDTVTLRVANRLREGMSSIHWHGLILPANMDGVPGLSFDGIRPGESYVYRFRVGQSGTYWYHSHSLFQEQAGLYGAIVIDPREPAHYRYDREHVLLLSDWTDLEPAALFRRLKQMSSYDNYYKRTVGDAMRDVGEKGLAATLRDRGEWGRMRMTPTDLSDVNAHTYTYLLNGVTPAGNWTGLFKPGEKVLLRFVNGSAMTYFDVRIPGLKMTVVAADGQPVHPVSVDEFRIAVAETYDVLVEPSGQDAYTIFCQDNARTGYVRGTLAVRQGLEAEVPRTDPRPLLTMEDMGHGDMSGDGGHDMSKMKGMEGGCGASMGAKSKGMEGGCGANMGGMAAPASGGGMDHAAMGHAGMDHGAMKSAPGGDPRLIDMRAMSLSPKLDDPGIGLRGNGRKVLTYSDLHSVFDDPDGREPSREIELHLTGHMEKFAWSFDGQKFMGADPIRLTYGERLRIVLVNDTMMTHPIHLHGLWSDLENDKQEFQVRKHTIDMPPGTRRSYRVRADALGRWAFHCHLLYHMEAGMMREVRVEE